MPSRKIGDPSWNRDILGFLASVENIEKGFRRYKHYSVVSQNGVELLEGI